MAIFTNFESLVLMTTEHIYIFMVVTGRAANPVKEEPRRNLTKTRRFKNAYIFKVRGITSDKHFRKFFLSNL